MPQVQSYSLRRANPFRGVVAVVKTEAGRALSADGVHWQIQVLAHAPRGLWANAEYEETLQYFRFGVWDPAEGLTRVPLNPLLEVGRMISAAAELTRLLPERTQALPFPPAPEEELWLLDRDGAPLALLATTTGGTDPATLGVDQWSAGGRGERPFVSATLSAQGINDQDSSGRFQHLEALERLIRRTAGTSRNRRWFRTAEDTAEPAATDPAAGGGGCPELLVRDRWPDEVSQGLIDDYLGWLSPYLLMLPTLSDRTRERLEHEARHHALLVEATWRLYPKILDPALLQQARVEARLRRASAA